jgi:anti-anti-sigma factor
MTTTKRLPTPVLHLTGDIDYAVSPKLRRELDRRSAQPPDQIVVDLSGVTFMDCSGLRPLLEVQERIGDRLRLENLPRQVSRLLQLTGLCTTFSINSDPSQVVGPRSL